MVELPENRKTPPKEEIERLIKNNLPEADRSRAPKISFDMCESFIPFIVGNQFIYNLDMIDDPLFLEANACSMELETPVALEEKIVAKKVPATLSGYLLYDKEGLVIGFSCLESQLKTDD